MTRTLRRQLSPAAAALAAVGFVSCVTAGPHKAEAPALDPPKVAASGDTVTQMELVRGAWLRVRDAGAAQAGTPVVFVHGYGSRLEAWRLVQPAVSATHRTISYDQRGFGLSEKPAGAYGPQSHADDLLALLDARGIERAILVGHSYGTGVVVRFALMHPERVKSIVLVSPFLLDRQLTPTFRLAQLPGFGEAIFGAFYTEVPGEKYLLAFADPKRFTTIQALDEMEALMARPGSTYAALETVRGMDYAAVEASYPSLGVPVRIVWGEKDRVVRLALASEMAKAFPGAAITTVKTAGHMPPWEAPQTIVDAILANDGAPASPLAREAPAVAVPSTDSTPAAPADAPAAAETPSEEPADAAVENGGGTP